MKAPGTDIHSEAFLHSLMRKQLRLSITCAAAFLVVVLGLPLANYFLPELMATRILGFTLTWFVLGIGFFPAVWVISFFFIRRSIALEDEEVREAAGAGGGEEGRG
jgi:putative solute:sodium symporter small subunit